MAEKSPKAETLQPVIQRVLNSKAETRSYYNKIAQFYDLLAEHSEGPLREIGLRLLAPQAGEHVLEIGSGTGHCLVEFAAAVGASGQVFGIDLSEKMVELATARVTENGFADRVEVACGDAEHLPYQSATMDAIFMSFTLELFDTPAIPIVLAECLRVLRPGGRIVVVAVSHEGKPGLGLRVYEWTHQHFPNLLDCRPIYVQQALEQAAFQIRETRQGHMWVPVEIVLGVKPH